MSQRKIILHPTDFSDSSRYAFRLAGSLARLEGARLIVLHVDLPPGPMVAYGEILTAMKSPVSREKLGKVLRHLRVPDPNVPVEYQVLAGKPAAVICRLAEETGCNLIVMGTHGRTGVSRLLLGSVAQEVMREAPCPVVTVKMPHRVPRQDALPSADGKRQMGGKPVEVVGP